MPAILGALIPAAVGLGSGLLKGGTKTGKDTTQTQSFGQTTAYDPTKFQYGGTPGGADEAANRNRWWADHAQTRGAQTADFQYNQPNYDSAQGALGSQGQMAALMAGRATGAIPSVAQMQGDRQMQQAQASQASMAASARGAGAMALGQQNAANNTANAQGAISGQTQINAAQERLAATNAAYGAYSGIANDATQRAQYGAQLGTDQAKFNAGLQNDQRARNDAMTMGMSAQEAGVRQTALGGGVAQQKILSGSIDRQQGEKAQQGHANAAWENKNWDDTAKAISGGAGGGMAGPAMGKGARGGPVGVGTPYLVGEEGPEIIVPRNDGTVIPAGPTASLLKGGAPQARARGGPVGGVRVLSPAKAGPVAVMGQPKAPTLAKGGKGKGAAKPPATMPMATRKPRPEDYDAPDLDQSPASQWNGSSTFIPSGEERRTSQMLDDRQAQTAPPAPAMADIGRGSLGEASPADQARFERKLTGQPEPEGRYMAPELDDAQADKIRASFAADKQQDEATARWEQSFGKSSEAGAGVRDGGKPAVPMWQQVLVGALGGAREEGGFISGIKKAAGNVYKNLSAPDPAASPADQHAHEAQRHGVFGIGSAMMHPAQTIPQYAQMAYHMATAQGADEADKAREPPAAAREPRSAEDSRAAKGTADDHPDAKLRVPTTPPAATTADDDDKKKKVVALAKGGKK